MLNTLFHTNAKEMLYDTIQILLCSAVNNLDTCLAAISSDSDVGCATGSTKKQTLGLKGSPDV